MRRAVVALAAGLFLGGVALAAALPEQGKGKKQKHERAVVVHEDRAVSNVAVQVVFVDRDVVVLREHYGPRYRNLPPGLRKKLARGGQLPPGWQKKLQPFPSAVERRLEPLPSGYRRGVIDGHAVIYNSRSHVMVDVAVLF